ncbi:CUAEP/CCAEP-tail radical SAM (seleno)protein [Devosia sp. CN2-171]|uniref:CUAEP/CCAEP-tail radical SAM (seleno)protein n=1 Tax=Devosia sp. CN2-171 TaxID=3400909 RepID=UPI003BF857FA
MRVLILSTFDIGHQPFGVASLAGWLKRDGADVRCLDLAVETPDPAQFEGVGLVCFYLPMHTATRLAVPVMDRVHRSYPEAHICCFGLYAPLNAEYLCSKGAMAVVGGEYEQAISDLYRRLTSSSAQAIPLGGDPAVSIRLDKLKFQIPSRRELPPLSAYAKLNAPDGQQQLVGYTEASRGCKHLCRHCPIVPVYQGQFRIVQPDIVLADIRQQVALGAKHISFGDPDFLNGPGHALAIAERLHAEFPQISFDVVIKVEHLLKHRSVLPRLRALGCVMITSAVEAVDDRVLIKLAKQHTRNDVFDALQAVREAGIHFIPTFLPFTPWTTAEDYIELLSTIERWGLVNSVAPVQLAIRLLLPKGSLLLELDDVRDCVERFDDASLAYIWTHPDPRMDSLQMQVKRVVQIGEGHHRDRAAIFDAIFGLAESLLGHDGSTTGRERHMQPAMPPTMSEAWYCCAEPTDDQFNRL